MNALDRMPAPAAIGIIAAAICGLLGLLFAVGYLAGLVVFQGHHLAALGLAACTTMSMLAKIVRHRR